MRSRVELFEAIRRDHRREELSIRELADRHKVHRRTVRQALEDAVPPPRKTYPPRPRPAIDPWTAVVDGWLLADVTAPRKQRHTARRVWQRLVSEHHATVSEVTVSRYVAARKRELGLDRAEVTIPQTHSGTGKSHLLIELGLAACEQGRRVRYVTTAQLVNELVEAADERVLSRVVARYGRLRSYCWTSWATSKIGPRGAELLFQIITEREERASIAIATNLLFSEWGTVFPNSRLVAAIVDRVTFNAHILETGTQSYRLRTSKTSTRRKRSG